MISSPKMFLFLCQFQSWHSLFSFIQQMHMELCYVGPGCREWLMQGACGLWCLITLGQKSVSCSSLLQWIFISCFLWAKLCAGLLMSALSLVGVAGMGVLWSLLEGGALFGPRCSQESSLEADGPQEAREHLALGCIGLFPKWMNVRLFLVNLFLQTNMGNGLSKQKSSSDDKKNTLQWAARQYLHQSVFG